MDTIGSRVRQEREAQGVDRKELANRTGIGYSTISELERGGMQTTTKLRLIADALGVSLRWLETGKGPKEPAAHSGSSTEADWADIQGYAQAMGLGSGAEAQEYAETHKLKFRADSLSRKRLRPHALAVMYGKGDSMEPRIHSGDAILFDTSDTRPRDGDLFVIMTNGAAAKEYNVKRCEIIDDEVFFKADNPAGDHNWKKPKRMNGAKHHIEIIGRVRWIGSWEG